jgi:hypothetical protein
VAGASRIFDPRGLPDTGRYHRQRTLAASEIVAQAMAYVTGFAERVKVESIPGVMVPDLIRANPVQRRKLTCLEQEVDYRRSGSDALVHGARDRQRSAEQLCIMPPFGVRIEREQLDHLFSGGCSHGPTIPESPIRA